MVGTGRFELPAPRTPNWQDRPIFVETFTCEVHDEVTPEGRSNADIMMAGREGLFTPHGRLAQLVRAPALQAGSRGFESLTAHHLLFNPFNTKELTYKNDYPFDTCAFWRDDVCKGGCDESLFSEI